MATSEILLAYTTATDARPLYRRDSLNAVALPKGWTITLSYRSKWIAPGLIAELNDDLFVDCEMLFLVARGEQYVPLRYCKVLKTQMAEADLALLHIEMGRRPSDQMVGHFIDFAKEHQWPFPKLGSDGAGTRHYLHRIRGISDSLQEATFETQVSALQQCIEPANSQYFMITRLSQVKRSLIIPATMQAPTLRDREATELTLIDLRAGQVYNLEVYVHGDSLRGGESPIEFFFKGDQVDIAEPLLKQYGSGALLSHLIAVKRQYASELATLVIRMRQPDKDSEPRPSAEAQVLLRIRPAWYFWPSTVILFVLGNVGLQMTKDALGAFHLSQPDLVVLGAKLAGGGLLAFAAWLAFRTVPIKL
jgi:hypothetical protein